MSPNSPHFKLEVSAARVSMTRFKELRRIEKAIDHRDQVDLRWAVDYCQLRLRLARTKQGMSQWQRLEKRVRAVLDASNR